MNINNVNQFFRGINLSQIARYFAELITRMDSRQNALVYLTGGLVCYHLDRGDIRFNISEYAGQTLAVLVEDEEITFNFPPVSEWIVALESSRLIGDPGQRVPLILSVQGDKAWVYLLKYWKYEQTVINFILGHIKEPRADTDEDILSQSLSRLFEGNLDEPDWQKEAVKMAVRHRFCMVTGGPGTGKTTTVMKIIEALKDQSNDRPLSIALTAPTGKATIRLKEAVGQSYTRTDGISDQSSIMIETATTHRLLRSIAGTPYFKHDQSRPLSHDVIILDEASMLDVGLFARLIRALPSATRLVLLGDQHQLSSVEAGSLFGDICGIERSAEDSVGHPLENHIVRLKTSYRFDTNKGIGRLSESVNQGKGKSCYDLMTSDRTGSLVWKTVSNASQLNDTLRSELLPRIVEYFEQDTIDAAFQAFERVMILCAVRKGPFGVENLNRAIENFLIERRIVHASSDIYPGKPILITRNHYETGLFNGDIGILFRDTEDNNQIKAFFKSADGGYRKLSVATLPSYEPVYAMTVHKSQGSEFNKVILVLPDQPVQVLTRELIYTAVTRARGEVIIWGTESVLVTAIQRAIVRDSRVYSTFWAAEEKTNGG